MMGITTSWYEAKRLDIIGSGALEDLLTEVADWLREHPGFMVEEAEIAWSADENNWQMTLFGPAELVNAEEVR